MGKLISLVLDEEDQPPGRPDIVAFADDAVDAA
jgi:hypothetical protein